jgi:hypothetical protein
MALGQRFALVGSSDGLAAFLCLGFPPNKKATHRTGGNLPFDASRQRQDSESRQDRGYAKGLRIVSKYL